MRGMQKTHESVSLALAGSGGAGVMTAGNLLLEAAAQAGYYALMTRTSGPQIRGGEAAAMLRISTFASDAQDDRFRILAAIDWQNVGRFAAEIPLDGSSLIIGDPSQGEAPEAFARSRARYAPVPFKQLAKQEKDAWPNMIALGVLGGLIGLPAQALERAVAKSMKKGVEAGIAAVRIGIAQAATLDGFPLAKPPSKAPRWLIT